MSIKKTNRIISGRKSLIIKMIFTFCFLILASCAMLNSPSNLVLNEKSNGKKIKASVGSLVTVNLKGNATTGYIWELQKYDEKIFKFIDLQYEPEKTNLVGAGGVSTAKFEIVQKGTGVIELCYKRPWEKDKEPDKTYSITVTVD